MSEVSIIAIFIGILVTNLVVGIFGAFLGAFVANVAGIGFAGFWGSLLVSTVGAILLLALTRMLRGRWPL